MKIDWESMSHAEFLQAARECREESDKRMREMQEALGIESPKERKPYTRSIGKQPEAD
jgi:hypothetical protein